MKLVIRRDRVERITNCDDRVDSPRCQAELVLFASIGRLLFDIDLKASASSFPYPEKCLHRIVVYSLERCKLIVLRSGFIF
jgi:hypothetical protein